MQIHLLIEQMAVLMLILLVGYVATKLKVLGTTSNQILSRLVTTLLLPCLLILSATNLDLSMSTKELVVFLSATIVLYAILGIFTIFMPMLLRVPKEDAGTLRFLTMFGNVAFMGMPLTTALYGPGAAFLTTMINIPFQFLCYTMGITMIRSGNLSEQEHAKETQTEKPSLFRRFLSLFSPPTVASIIAIVIFLFRIPVHPVLYDTIAFLGNCTVPMAMLIIGTSLAGIRFKEVLTDKTIFIFVVIRMLILPVVVWAVLRLFLSDEVMLGVAVILSAMPIATNATMLAIQYGGNEQLASKSIFVTTILSAVTVPLILFLLM